MSNRRQPAATAPRKPHRLNRAVGTTSAVGAFLAFGLLPLAGAPAARADVDDLFTDLFAQVDSR